mmetsp:Transcript_9382/g.17225  ORF Transcript_9382/g.17225 Transcript_9382/m.17225 type:complete len:560 (-) Transcript_9382:508-2187(-)
MPDFLCLNVCIITKAVTITRIVTDQIPHPLHNILQLLLIHLTRPQPQLRINKRLSLAVQQINIVRLKPHLEHVVFRPRVTKHTRLHKDGLAKLFRHPLGNLLRHNHVALLGSDRHNQMTAKRLLSLGIFPVFEPLHGRELIAPLLTLLAEFTLERLVLLHELLLQCGRFVCGGRAVVGIEDIVTGFEALVVEEEVILLLVVHLVHPVFQREHLAFLIVHGRGVEGDDARLTRVLFGDFVVPDALVVALQLGHVGGLDVIPCPFEVLGALIGVAFVHFQLGHPVGEHDGGLGVVFKAGQDEIGHVEFEVVHEPHFRLGTGHGVRIFDDVEYFVLSLVRQLGPILFDVHVGHGVAFAKVGLVVQPFAGVLVGGDLLVEFDQVLFVEGTVGREDQVLPVFLDLAAGKGIKAAVVIERSCFGNGLWINRDSAIIILGEHSLQILFIQHIVILAQNPLHLLQIHILLQLLPFFLCHLAHNVFHRFRDILRSFKVARHLALGLVQLLSLFHLGQDGFFGELIVGIGLDIVEKGRGRFFVDGVVGGPDVCVGGGSLGLWFRSLVLF